MDGLVAQDGGLSRTRDALRRWAAALPAGRYALTLVPAAPGEDAGAEKRLFSCDQLLAAAGWLRSRNAAAFHVFGRPDEARHVLVDDLSVEALGALRAAHHVAAAIMTSPGSHQAWVTVSADPLPPPLATAAARQLAARFGGDVHAADAHHRGRLPELRNLKPARRREDGGHPWTRLLWAEPGVDPAGAALLGEALERSTAPLRRPPMASPDRAPAVRPAAPHPRRHRPRWASAAAEHTAGEARLRGILPPDTILDRSRLDMAIARRLLGQGAQADFVRAVVAAGAKASELCPTIRASYAVRTVKAARRALAGEGPGRGTVSAEARDAEEGGRPHEAA